jgi:hypothetical protein
MRPNTASPEGTAEKLRVGSSVPLEQ